MRLLFFFIAVAICIAGSRNQEIALGTDYIRAHVNETSLSGSAINAQVDDFPPPAVIGFNSGTSTDSTSSTTGSTKTTDDDESPENDDDNRKKLNYDHEHHSHHEHEATISVDVHNIIDIFKQQLHETEERILAAVRQTNTGSSNSGAVPVLKSYRTIDR